MKPVVLILMVFCSVPVLAQEETLLGSGEIEHGGYGGPVVKLTSVNDEFGVLVGGRGGWIINHVFSLGFAGYGLANSVEALSTGPLGQNYLELGYGGVDLEYIVGSDRMVHFSIHSLIGGGSAGFQYGWEGDRGWTRNEYDTFFVFEPGVNIDINLTTWFRTSFGVEYRYVNGVTTPATTNADISGVSGVISLRFGKF